jgi:hypothetical protein
LTLPGAQSFGVVFCAQAQSVLAAHTPYDSPLTAAQQLLLHSLGQTMLQIAWHSLSFEMQVAP